MKTFAKAYNLELFFCFLATLVMLSFGQLLRVNLTIGAFYPHDVSIGLFLASYLLGQLVFRHKNSVIHFYQRAQFKQYWLEIVAGLWLALSLSYHLFGSHNLIPMLYSGRILFYSLFIIFSFKQLKLWQKVDFLPRWLWFFLIINFVTFFGLAQYFLFYDLRALYFLGWDDHLGRLVSTLLDPNFAGFLIGFGLIYWQSLKTKLSPWIYWSANLIFILALTLTFSRASYLSTLTGLGLTSLLSKSRSAKLANVVIILGLIGGIIFIPKPPGEGGKLLRSASIKARIVNDLSSLGLPTNFERLKQSKVITHNQSLIMQTTHSYTINHQLPFHATWPNNLEVFIYHQFGLVGLILFLVILIKWGKQLYLKNKLAGIFLIGLLIHAQFNNTAFEPFVFLIFWGSLAEVLRLKLDI